MYGNLPAKVYKILSKTIVLKNCITKQNEHYLLLQAYKSIAVWLVKFIPTSKKIKLEKRDYLIRLKCKERIKLLQNWVRLDAQ